MKDLNTFLVDGEIERLQEEENFNILVMHVNDITLEIMVTGARRADVKKHKLAGQRARIMGRFAGPAALVAQHIEWKK